MKADITRRRFCGSVLLVSSAAALGATRINALAAQPRDTLIAYPPMKIEGAERVLPGGSLYFSYPNHNDPAVLVRSPEGEFSAYSRKCAHLGCSVEFSAARRCLACPCHQGTYDSRTGFVLFGPPVRPLDQIVLEMRAGGQVWAVGKSIGNSNPNS